MPDTVSTNLADIKAAAAALRNEEVTKELTKKYKVIAKRRNQLDAHVKGFEAKVTAFETQLNASENPEQIVAALAAHKFPASTINLSVSQDD